MMMMMELKGALSNPQVTDEVLPKLSALYHKLLSRDKARPKHLSTPKRPGEVAKTVYSILSEAGITMHVREIHELSEKRLGRKVPYSTVKDSLSEHSMGPDSRYLRVTLGRYLVRPR